MMKGFVIRQFARFRVFVQKFGSFFTMANFITLILILLTDMGLDLDWYWILIIYFTITVCGLLLIFVLEKMKLFDVEFLQIWKMNKAKLYKQQTKYVAIMVELMRRKSEEELLEIKQDLEKSWK